MAPWSRKRKDTPEPAHRAPDPPKRAESVRLDGDDHAWWAQGEVTEVWRPRERQSESDATETDILAEQFGADWRTSFGFTSSEDDPEVEDPASADPYAVLGIDPAATWDEIVAAHRHQARVHHPDRLFGQSEAERTEGDDRIRQINAAYQELRIRRDM